MKRLVAHLLAVTLAGVVVAGCDDSGTRVTSSPGSPTVNPDAVSVRGYVRGDNDADESKSHEDRDDYSIHRYGSEASAADRRSIESVVKRDYALAAAGDGGAACSLLDRHLGRGTALADAAESYAPSPSAPPLSGKPCAYIMSLLFKENHRQLLAEAATFEITSIRVNGDRAIALLAFKALPERQMPLRREGGTWGLTSLFDKELP